MKVWKKGEGVEFKNHEGAYGTLFSVAGANLDLAIITIKSRYPKKGFVYNVDFQEMVYVIDGSGRMETGDLRVMPLQKGDAVHLMPNERVAWDGDMTLGVPCSPGFNPDKHKFTD